MAISCVFVLIQRLDVLSSLIRNPSSLPFKIHYKQTRTLYKDYKDWHEQWTWFLCLRDGFTIGLRRPEPTSNWRVPETWGPDWWSFLIPGWNSWNSWAICHSVWSCLDEGSICCHILFDSSLFTPVNIPRCSSNTVWNTVRPIYISIFEIYLVRCSFFAVINRIRVVSRLAGGLLYRCCGELL